MKRRGYRSPRNKAFSMIERGAVVSPTMMARQYPEITVGEAKQALDALVRMGRATVDYLGFYEVTEDHRVRK